MNGNNKVTANVTALNDGPSVKYEMDWKFDDDTKSGNKDKPIEFDRNTGPHDITFHLKDSTKPPRGIKFASPAKQAMFVSTSGCPKKEGNGGQIVFGKSSDNKLEVQDANSGEKCDLHYSLNFLDKNGKKVKPFDPIIKNGGKD